MTGWLIDVERIPSPNYRARPPGIVIDMLVVHSISLPPGAFGGTGIVDCFLNQLDPNAHPYYKKIAALRVSAHISIDRLGKITQYVDFQNCAWHAGVSVWQGRTHCNDYSIGVELEGADGVPYTQAQYDRLVALCVLLMRQYPGITMDRVVRHSDIAPGRKTDPGPAFRWEDFRDRLQFAYLSF